MSKELENLFFYDVKLDLFYEDILDGIIYKPRKNLFSTECANFLLIDSSYLP